MTQLMEQARALARDGRWLDVRALDPALLGCSEKDLPVAHGLLVMAYLNTAACPDDWRQALGHGRRILSITDEAAAIHLWALQAIAAVYSNLGRPRETQAYARAFLRKASGRPDMQAHVPNAYHELGYAARQLHQYGRALQYYRLARAGFRANGNHAEEQRVQLKLVWALLKAGRPAQAQRELPAEVTPALVPVWHAARALLAAAERQWEQARKLALLALEGPLLPIDNIVAAEMCHLLAQVTLRHGARAEAVSWSKQATEFAARLGQAILTRLVLATAAEGGDFLAAVASRGSGGFHPDACLSTGVGG